MCTAATYKTKDFYMGRTLDYEFSYGDEVTVTPRNYPINFRFMGVRNNHFAMIGMAHVADDYPLYYEAFNEKGLGMAGLNFVGNAAYNEPDQEALTGRVILKMLPFSNSFRGYYRSVRQLMKLKKDLNLLILPTLSLMKCFHVLISTGLLLTRKTV